MKIREKTVTDILTKSNISVIDYVINPYVGCMHACKYCYACFMKRFTNHPEPWGTFSDVKIPLRPISLKKIKGKKVFLSSVTDPYNPLEAKYKVTRDAVLQLVGADCEVNITTKSSLILRDLDLIKRLKNVTVTSSINTLDEGFRRDMDKASPIAARLDMLKKMHAEGIRTAIFISPIFPYITDFKAIIEASKDFVDEYWFENLKLRPPYKSVIMAYIMKNYPQYYKGYKDIYINHEMLYWCELGEEIRATCEENKISYDIYFSSH